MTRVKRSLHVPNVGHQAPIPLGARVGPLLCSSGIAGKDPATGELPADGALQVQHAFANLQALLAAGGAQWHHVVKLGVTLADDSLRGAVNREWLALCPDPDDRPARHITVQPLSHGMAVQLDILAYVA